MQVKCVNVAQIHLCGFYEQNLWFGCGLCICVDMQSAYKAFLNIAYSQLHMYVHKNVFTVHLLKLIQEMRGEAQLCQIYQCSFDEQKYYNTSLLLMTNRLVWLWTKVECMLDLLPSPNYVHKNVSGPQTWNTKGIGTNPSECHRDNTTH